MSITTNKQNNTEDETNNNSENVFNNQGENYWSHDDLYNPNNPSNGSSINLGGTLGGAGSILGGLGAAYSTYTGVKDAKDFSNGIRANQLSSNTAINSFDDWLRVNSNYTPLAYPKYNSMGYNSTQGWFNAAKSAGMGAIGGMSMGNPILGAAIGGFAGIASNLFAKQKADEEFGKVKSMVDDVNTYNQLYMENQKEELKRQQYNSYRYNFKDNGGPLQMKQGLMTPFGKRFDAGGGLHTQGSDWSNGIISINEGLSHEANPNDGVQMGVDPQGIPNLVEEGEVVFNDYVFSNRLVVPKSVRKKYKLRDKKGLTFADAAKEVQKESEERPNDPISKRGLEDWMAKLTNEQENVRQKKAMRQLEKQADELGVSPEELLAQQSQEQQLQQQMPMDATGMSMPMMAAYGGGIHIKPSKKGTFTEAASKHGMGVQEFASKVLANKDDYSPAMVKKANFAKNAAGWKHGLGGNLFLYGSDMIAGPEEPESFVLNPGYRWNDLNYSIFDIIPQQESSSTYTTSDFWKNIPKDKTVWTPGYGETTASNFKYNMENQKQKMLATNPPKAPELYNAPPRGTGWGLDKLRYIPALGSALGVFSDLMGWTNKPDYTNANMIMGAARNIPDIRYRPIGDYMAYTPLDRMFYMNQANANAAATRRALMNTSGGNWGTARAALLAADANHINSLGQIARQAEEYNLAQREKVATFNRATNMANAENDLKAQMANQNKYQMFLSATEAAAKMRDAIDARASAGRSANLTNLFDNLGNIGWEEFNRNMVNTSNPYYNIDSSGRVFWTKAGLALSEDQKRRALKEYGYYRGKSKMNYSPLDNIYTIFG